MKAKAEAEKRRSKAMKYENFTQMPVWQKAFDLMLLPKRKVTFIVYPEAVDMNCGVRF